MQMNDVTKVMLFKVDSVEKLTKIYKNVLNSMEINDMSYTEKYFFEKV